MGLDGKPGRRGAAALVLACALLSGVPAGAAAAPARLPAQSTARSSDACVAGENLGEIANNFISRCRRGSIRQAFPGEHYGDSLGYLRGCGLKSCQTAWKLLNDNRFKK
ncbi:MULTISPECIES: hypothetical protein [unclassified Streptomyces]|uniref:hypothetical protein n=1 Tax=unclassified Streptomyces TaxID=2593676 RepID=UPI0004C71510|nr:hypothetical protein [Streptomyces sp. NRRL F-2747]